MKNPKLTVADGLKLQQAELQIWGHVLKDEAMGMLIDTCIGHNLKLTGESSGYDVFRGQSVASAVYKIAREPAEGTA